MYYFLVYVYEVFTTYSGKLMESEWRLDVFLRTNNKWKNTSHFPKSDLAVKTKKK